jgi:hypothetical protein
VRQYFELAGFENLYLEDSFVLSIRVAPRRVEIEIEFVLHDGHPQYEAPAVDEQYCYRRGSIVFDAIRRVRWSGLGEIAPAVDARGDADYGGINSLGEDEETYRVEGDFGSLEIESSNSPEVVFGDSR